MIYFKRLLIALALLGLSSGLASASGTSGGRILNMEVNPAVAALGGAYAARATDISGVTQNPAGLVRMYAPEVRFSHSLYFLDTSLTSLSLAGRLGVFGLGFEWKSFVSEDTYRDEMGQNKASFDNRYTQMTFAGGFPITQRISIGAALKSISEELYEESASAMSFDAGVYILGYRGDSFALVFNNLLGEIEHIDEGSPTETGVTLAGAHRMGSFIFSWDLTHTREIDLGWRAGLEYDLEALILRGGVSMLNDTDFALGFGIPYGRWSIDYSFSPHRDLNAVHRFSLGAHF